MNEVGKFIEKEKKVENAKRYLANLKAQIEDAQARYELMPRYYRNSNLDNPDRMSLHHEINRLKKEYRDNEHAIKSASVDDDVVDATVGSMDI